MHCDSSDLISLGCICMYESTDIGHNNRHTKHHCAKAGGGRTRVGAKVCVLNMDNDRTFGDQRERERAHGAL